MNQSLVRAVLALLAATVMSANESVAQSERPVAFFAGITGLRMESRWGNYLAGGQVGASIGTSHARRLGAELSGRLIVPAGGASAIPDCIPNVECRSYHSPSLLGSYAASVRVNAAANRLRLLGGAGYLHTAGMRGSDHNHSPMLQGEVQYRVRPSARVSPLASFSVMHLSHSFAGARQILLASIGVEF